MTGLPWPSTGFMTAAEIAAWAVEVGCPGFPESERGVRKWAAREGWDRHPPSLVRERQGAGRPALEYHLSLLPDALRLGISVFESRKQAARAVVEKAEADRRRMLAMTTASLSAHARRVMEARAEILTSIEGYAVSRGETRAWGIRKFLEAQAQAGVRAEVEAARDAGRVLSAQDRDILAKRLDLTASDGFALSVSRVAEANDRRAEPVVKRSSVYAWFKAREERGVVGLAPVATKAEQPIPKAFGDFLRFYALPQKPSAQDAWETYADWTRKEQGVQAMTLTLSQCRYFLRNRLNNIEKNVGREGLLTLRSRLPYVTRTTEDMWPTTIYTADGKTFDAEVADPASGRPMRPEITSVLDVATRKCVGFAISRKENVVAVTEGLRNACTAQGIPAIFYTDRGGGYKNKTFDAEAGGLMARLGITKMHALPYNSQAKGIVERFNAIWNKVAKRLPTYIGADMDKEAEKRAHKATRRDIKEFGRSPLLPSWDDFLVMVAAEVERYNARPHAGLPKFTDPETGRTRHMSPDEAWDGHVAAGFEAIRVDPAEADNLFRPHEVRVCRRALVEWNTNTYFHADLEAWHDCRVAVGYDQQQADRVWVRAIDRATGEIGHLICVAEFTGNRHRYVAHTKEQAALEGRVKGQLRLVSRKAEAIEQQLTPPYLDVDPLVAEPLPADLPLPSAAVAGPRRRVFSSDEELAQWALAHPGDLTPNQIAVLRDCLSRPSAREVFRLSGIDTEALRTLLRAVA